MSSARKRQRAQKHKFEVDALRSKLALSEHHYSMLKTLSEVIAKRCQDAEANAKRYRWLLNHHSSKKDDGTAQIAFTCDFENYNNPDASLDAEIAKEPVPT